MLPHILKTLATWRHYGHECLSIKWDIFLPHHVHLTNVRFSRVFYMAVGDHSPPELPIFLFTISFGHSLFHSFPLDFHALKTAFLIICQWNVHWLFKILIVFFFLLHLFLKHPHCQHDLSMVFYRATSAASSNLIICEIIVQLSLSYKRSDITCQ